MRGGFCKWTNKNTDVRHLSEEWSWWEYQSRSEATIDPFREDAKNKRDIGSDDLSSIWSLVSESDRQWLKVFSQSRGSIKSCVTSKVAKTR